MQTNNIAMLEKCGVIVVKLLLQQFVNWFAFSTVCCCSSTLYRMGQWAKTNSP